MGAYCTWFEKNIRDIAEWEEEQCKESNRDCDGCQDLKITDDYEGEE